MDEIDSTTGLPALPEGEFWRVEQRTTTENSSYTFVIEAVLVQHILRIEHTERTRFLRRTRQVTEEMVLGSSLVREPWSGRILRVGELTPELLVKTCRYVLIEEKRKQKEEEAEILRKLERMRGLANATRLLGDYPPKYIPIRDRRTP